MQIALVPAGTSFPNSPMEINMKYLNTARIVAIAVAVSFALGACNTMSGAGKDIERGGQKIEKAAEKAKD